MNTDWVTYLPLALFLAALLSGALAIALTVRYQLSRRLGRHRAVLAKRTAEQARTKGAVDETPLAEVWREAP